MNRCVEESGLAEWWIPQPVSESVFLWIVPVLEHWTPDTKHLGRTVNNVDALGLGQIEKFLPSVKIRFRSAEALRHGNDTDLPVLRYSFVVVDDLLQCLVPALVVLFPAWFSPEVQLRLGSPDILT